MKGVISMERGVGRDRGGDGRGWMGLDGRLTVMMKGWGGGGLWTVREREMGMGRREKGLDMMVGWAIDEK